MRTRVVWGVVVLALVGCSGAQGPAGDQGPPGPVGAQGPAGRDGTDGSNGTDGADGMDGTPGRDGDAGLDGRSAWATGPGVRVELTGLTQVGGEAVAQLRVTDDEGTPLDVTGRLTSGPVQLDLLLALQDQAMRHWLPSTTSPAFPTMGSPGVLAATDVTQGRYTFTFRPSPPGLVASATQVVLAVARRTVSGVTRTSSARFSPSARGVVTQENCTQCHGAFDVHEERFTDVEQCPVCHQPQLRQADGGTDLDWQRLMHRVHAGGELPSVSAGERLVFTARDGGVLDATASAFPRTLKHCESCHDAQGAGLAWSGAPGITACGSCHDRTAFAPPAPTGWTLHPGGMVSDGTCATCHDRANLEARHAHPSFDAGVPGLEIELLPLAATGPGQTPVIDFRVTRDGVPLDVLATPLTMLRFQVVGPNTDFRGWELGPLRSGVAQGASPAGALVAVNPAAGEFRYTTPFTLALPASASGSFTVSADANLLVGTSRIVARSPMRAFAVTDPAPVPRRSIIDPAKCDACHLQLEAHGSRRGAESCVVCHDSSLDDGDFLPRFESSTRVARSLDFKVMIHAIHRGAQLTVPYQLGAFPGPSTSNPAGTQRDFSTVRMPRSVGDCAMCHLAPAMGARPSWALPFPSVVGVRHRTFACSEDPGDDVNELCATWLGTPRSTPPQTAVCTSCHDQPWVAAHAEVNTTASGVEACATCHEGH